MTQAQRSELEREDVLELLSIASNMKDHALGDLLAKFCNVNSKVRFASLWRLNEEAGTISIYARSNGDYLPQLGNRDERIEEFLCPTSCPVLQALLNSTEFRSAKRLNYSIRKAQLYGTFHRKEIVDEYGLDSLVLLPIETVHAPRFGLTPNQVQFFCLFYCPLGKDAEEVADVDLALIAQCLGNMIYNRFNEHRWNTIQRFTGFLSAHHDPDSEVFLDELKICMPCEAVFELSQLAGQIVVTGAHGNQFQISKQAAANFWSAYRGVGSKHLQNKDGTTIESSAVKSILVYQAASSENANRVIFLFCNKRSACPFAGGGQKTFRDDFGFDDVLLAEAVGEHVRAFTLTKAERKRRDDVTRIIAHEIKQPLVDIRNSLGKYHYSPERFGLALTHERIQDSADLALLLAEINTELSDERILRLTVRRKATIDAEMQLHKMRRLMRGLCEDVDFKNENITIDVASNCKTLTIARSLLATIFFNTVSNAVKYSSRNFEEAWCNVRLLAVRSDDPVWNQFNVHKKLRRSGLLITTTDNGQGIPADMIEKVFEKEIRLHHPDVAPGLGLGLFHLRRTVDALDGRVWIQSPADPASRPRGVGTRVFTILPESIVR